MIKPTDQPTDHLTDQRANIWGHRKVALTKQILYSHFCFLMNLFYKIKMKSYWMYLLCCWFVCSMKSRYITCSAPFWQIIEFAFAFRTKFTHIFGNFASYNEKVELVVCYKSSKKQESLAGQNGAADNKIDQVLRYELGRITSHPFRKLWQTEQPTNQPTDQQNNQPNDQHKPSNQPMDIKAHREVDNR